MKIILLSFAILHLAVSFTINESEPRIVGGTTAEVGAAPFQVSLQVPGFGHICGGAIIDKRWITTAAHCLDGYQQATYTILVGTNDRLSGGTKYHPEKWIIHPRYNQPPLNNDIGLIHLTSDIEFTARVQPIEIDFHEVPAGATITLTGWGLLESGGEIPVKLQTINLNTISYEECKWRHGGSPNVDVGHLCTLNGPGQGACNRDSGGPLTYKEKLVALVNWGSIPCAQGAPDAHAKLSFFYEWVRTTIAENTDYFD